MRRRVPLKLSIGPESDQSYLVFLEDAGALTALE